MYKYVLMSVFVMIIVLKTIYLTRYDYPRTVKIQRSGDMADLWIATGAALWTIYYFHGLWGSL